MKLTKVMAILGMTALILSSCGKAAAEKSEYFEVANLKWGMSVNEALRACEMKRDSVSEGEYGSSFVIQDGREIFGAKTERILLNFIDVTVSGDIQKLCEVDIMYSEDTDMSDVMENMKKSFGNPTEKIAHFPLMGDALHNTMMRMDYEANDKMTLWATKTVSEAISKEKESDYKKLWQTSMSWISDDNWKEFSENAVLVDAVCSDKADNAPVSGEKGVRINALNLVIYDTITGQLENN